MKKIFLLWVLTLVLTNAYSQTPKAFQYQAVVAGNGTALANANVKVRFTIREDAATGTSVYSEVHQTTTNAAGIISLQIGKGTTETGTFALINWAKGTFFIETEIDKDGAGTYVASGTQQFLSVPYAKYADNAGKIQLTSSGGKKWTLVIDEQGDISAQEITE
jgi:hypothetical protein